MSTPRADRRPVILSSVAALAVPALVGGALLPVRSRVDNATIALVLAITVVAAAVAVRRRSVAVVSSFVGALVFNLGFTRPYWSLRISARRDLETDVALLLMGLLAGAIGHSVQRHRDETRTSDHRFSFLSSLSSLAADGEAVDFLAISAAAELTQLLHLRDCSYSTRADAAVQLPWLGPDGLVRWGHLVWNTECWGMPSKGVALPVRQRGQLIGHLLMRPTPGHPVSRDALQIAFAYAAQVGAAAPASAAA